MMGIASEVTMKFAPLTPHKPSTGNPTISCLGCGRKSTYVDAAAAGWTYDSKGPPFLAYYCPICQKTEDNYQE